MWGVITTVHLHSLFKRTLTPQAMLELTIDQQYLAQIIIQPDSEDDVQWRLSATGRYTVKTQNCSHGIEGHTSNTKQDQYGSGNITGTFLVMVLFRGTDSGTTGTEPGDEINHTQVGSEAKQTNFYYIF